MSTWTVVVHRSRNRPVDISTDHPELASIFPLPVGRQIYSLPDAIKLIGYCMAPGDVITTELVDDRVGPICPGCDQECMGVWSDFGIGPYEYWGAPGVDVQMAYVSSCCEAALPEPKRCE